MRRLLPLLGTLILLCGSALPVAADDTAMTAEEQVASLSWLEGHWRGEEIEAIYSSPEGGVVVGMSKRYNDEGTSWYGVFEHISIREGVLTLVPYPGYHRSDSNFPVLSCDPVQRRVEFENLKHDWPTRFLFESPDENTLRIVRSGPEELAGKAADEIILTRVVDASKPQS